MIGPMYKTGEEIYNALQLVKGKLGVEDRPAKSSLKIRETYRNKIYAFSWFMSKKAEFVYIIKDLDTDNKKEEAKEMTKEEALKKIEELKAYVEKGEEKEIPKMQTNCLRDMNQCEIKAGLCSNFNRYITFQNQDTNAIWAIMSIELAHLLYAREYLGVLDHLTWTNWKVIFDICTCEYKVYSYTQSSALVDTSNVVPEFMWYFDNKDDAQRVCYYMNKYVKDIKRNMFKGGR